jgi:hypothetical protein
MNGTIVRLASLAALAALVACSGNSSSSASNAADNSAASPAAADNSAASPAAADNSAASPAAAGNDAMTAAFTKLAAAEDNGFTDVLGTKGAEDSDASYYGSTVSIPNYQCVVTISKKSTDKIASCRIITKTQADSDAAFAAAKATAQSALPDLKMSDQNGGPKYIASYFGSSDARTVLIYESKKGDGYQVGIGFATPAFYK